MLFCLPFTIEIVLKLHILIRVYEKKGHHQKLLPPEKRNHLTACLILRMKYTADGVSYNPTPFEADGGPYGSSKLQNGRL